MTPNRAFSESSELLTDLERTVASLWQDALNTPCLPGPADDFFDLGGDSVAMIMIELRIKEEFSIDLPEGALLSAPSLRGLCQLIEANRACGA
jgi:acyl carrier protein